MIYWVDLTIRDNKDPMTKHNDDCIESKEYSYRKCVEKELAG